MKVFEATTKFAISPHAKRHMHAEATSIKTRQGSCKWIATRARHSLQDPQEKHADLAGAILLGDSPTNRNASVSTLHSTTSGARLTRSSDYRLHTPNGNQPLGTGAPVRPSARCEPDLGYALVSVWKKHRKLASSPVVGARVSPLGDVRPSPMTK